MSRIEFDQALSVESSCLGNDRQHDEPENWETWPLFLVYRAFKVGLLVPSYRNQRLSAVGLSFTSTRWLDPLA